MQLAAKPPVAAGLTGKWSPVAQLPAFDLDIPGPTVSGFLPDGESVFTWAIFNGICGLVSSDEVRVSRSPSVLGTADVIDENIKLCSETSTILEADLRPGLTGTWTILDKNSPATLEDANLAAAKLTNLPPGETHVQWTISSALCPNFDSVVVIVFRASGLEANDDNFVKHDSLKKFAAAPSFCQRHFWRQS